MRTLMALLALPALSAFGCALEEGYSLEIDEMSEPLLAESTDSDVPEETPGETSRGGEKGEDPVGVDFSRSQFFGGGGGTLHLTPHQPLAGFQLRTGSRVDQITLIYSNGTRLTFGGGGGSLRPAQLCNPGDLAIGIHGGAGFVVDRLGLVCERPDGFQYSRAAEGGGGGDPFTYICPIIPEGLYGLDVRSGSLIDAVSARCD